MRTIFPSIKWLAFYLTLALPSCSLRNEGHTQKGSGPDHRSLWDCWVIPPCAATGGPTAFRCLSAPIVNFLTVLAMPTSLWDISLKLFSKRRQFLKRRHLQQDCALLLQYRRSCIVPFSCPLNFFYLGDTCERIGRVTNFYCPWRQNIQHVIIAGVA